MPRNLLSSLVVVDRRISRMAVTMGISGINTAVGAGVNKIGTALNSTMGM